MPVQQRAQPVYPVLQYLAAVAVSAIFAATIVAIYSPMSTISPTTTTMPTTTRPPPAPARVYQAACSAHPKCAAAALKGDCCPTSAGTLLGCCGQIAAGAKNEAFYSMCYAPAPTKTRGAPKTDDYMASWAQPLWGAGRDDLALIRSLGATTVRLYGNDPRLAHAGFLDRAQEVGLGVIVALSDYPYTQDPNKQCAAAPPYDCFDTIQSQYSQMLTNGFTIKLDNSRRVYHPAIRAIILINEPELKISFNGSTILDSRSKGYYAKAVISAFDGALAAERGIGVVPDNAGRLPPFTVTFSFATCENCLSQQRLHRAGDKAVGGVPALGFMYDVALAALSPTSFGYDARGDMRHALQNRFALGFNTQDTSDFICSGFLNFLGQSPLGALPVWAGEYKASYQSTADVRVENFEADLRVMRGLVDGTRNCTSSLPLWGFSVFEFQVSYWKGPGEHQMDFGVFELGSSSLGRTPAAEETEWQQYDVWCLRQKRNNFNESWVGPVARVFGGAVPSDAGCPAEAAAEKAAATATPVTGGSASPQAPQALV